MPHLVTNILLYLFHWRFISTTREMGWGMRNQICFLEMQTTSTLGADEARIDAQKQSRRFQNKITLRVKNSHSSSSLWKVESNPRVTRRNSGGASGHPHSAWLCFFFPGRLSDQETHVPPRFSAGSVWEPSPSSGLNLLTQKSFTNCWSQTRGTFQLWKFVIGLFIYSAKITECIYWDTPTLTLT